MATTHNCADCNSSEVRACARCNAIWYCGEACQKLDWDSSHRIVCKEYTRFMANNPRPVATDEIIYKLGILLPVDEAKPKFNWMNIRVANNPHPSSEIHHEAECSYLGSDVKPLERCIRAGYNMQDSTFKLTNPLLLLYRSEFPSKGGERNRSVRRFVDKNLIMPGPWYGPMMLFRSENDRPDMYQDVTLEDFTHLVSYIKMVPLDLLRWIC